MARGLLMIDIQNDDFPDGAMELVGMDAAAANAAALLMRFRDTGEPVFHVQHLASRSDAGFFLPGTAGAEINASVAPASSESVTRKHFANAFRETQLEDSLRHAAIDELIICGAMNHMCIDATTRAAFDAGFGCAVATDACATRDLVYGDHTVSADKVHHALMAALGSVYATIIESATFS